MGKMQMILLAALLGVASAMKHRRGRQPTMIGQGLADAILKELNGAAPARKPDESPSGGYEKSRTGDSSPKKKKKKKKKKHKSASGGPNPEKNTNGGSGGATRRR